MASKIPVIDLFCGCGGMSLGFHYIAKPSSLENEGLVLPKVSADFISAWANDFNEDAIKTFSSNFKVKSGAGYGPIQNFLEEDNFTIPKGKVVVGGPPCQGFSLLNKNKEGDERRQLWWHYLEVVEQSQSDVLVMENVPQLLDGEEYLHIVKRIRQLGFKYMIAGVLCAANYGVPQTRRRAIIMASRKHPICLPIPTHLPKANAKTTLDSDFVEKCASWRTVREAIGNLPKDPIGTEIGSDPKDPLSLHFGRTPTALSLKRYRAVPKGGNRFDLQKNAPELTPDCWIRKTSGGTDLFGRLWWDRPSVTIRTEFFKPEKGRYLHPEEHRPITHREAARLQSFPDEFIFQGNKTEIAKQIGNAVPPVFAYHLAYEVAMCLSGKRKVADMKAHAGIIAKSPLSTIREVIDG